MKMLLLTMAASLSCIGRAEPVISTGPLPQDVAYPDLSYYPFLIESPEWRAMHRKTSDATVLLSKTISAQQSTQDYVQTGFFIKTHPSRDYVCMLTAGHNFVGPGLLLAENIDHDVADIDYQFDFLYMLRYSNDRALYTNHPNFSSIGWKSTRFKIKKLELHPPSLDYALLLVPKREIPDIGVYTHGIDFLEEIQVPSGSGQSTGLYMIHHGGSRPQLISTLYDQNGGVISYPDSFRYQNNNWRGRLIKGSSGAALVFPDLARGKEGSAVGIALASAVLIPRQLGDQFKLIRIQKLIEDNCLITDEYKSAHNRRIGQYVYGLYDQDLDLDTFSVSDMISNQSRSISRCSSSDSPQASETSCNATLITLKNDMSRAPACASYNDKPVAYRRRREVADTDEAPACLRQVLTDITHTKNKAYALINMVKDHAQIHSNIDTAAIERAWEKLPLHSPPILAASFDSEIDLSHLKEYSEALPQFIKALATIQMTPHQPPDTWLPHSDNWLSWLLYRTGPGFIYYNTVAHQKKTYTLLPAARANGELYALVQRLANNATVIKQIIKQKAPVAPQKRAAPSPIPATDRLLVEFAQRSVVLAEKLLSHDRGAPALAADLRHRLLFFEDFFSRLSPTSLAYHKLSDKKGIATAAYQFLALLQQLASSNQWMSDAILLEMRPLRSAIASFVFHAIPSLQIQAADTQAGFTEFKYSYTNLPHSTLAANSSIKIYRRSYLTNLTTHVDTKFINGRSAYSNIVLPALSANESYLFRLDHTFAASQPEKMDIEEFPKRARLELLNKKSIDNLLSVFTVAYYSAPHPLIAWQPRAEGSTLNLFKIDPATGGRTLIQSLSLFDEMGVVDVAVIKRRSANASADIRYLLTLNERDQSSRTLFELATPR